MSSAAKAELGALFINAKLAVPICVTLLELGHPQPRMPMQTYNSIAYGVLTNRITPKATKSMGMRFHWLRCRDAQRQFWYLWRPGPNNTANYWTKNHPAVHHKKFRPQILTSQKYMETCRHAHALKQKPTTKAHAVSAVPS